MKRSNRPMIGMFLLKRLAPNLRSFDGCCAQEIEAPKKGRKSCSNRNDEGF
jgi:hypothetical protein